MSEKRTKSCYVGAPAIFALELACQHINAAFGGYGCYLVGSCMERADWRDVDVRFIMEDDQFARLFPDSNLQSALWEHDPRWLLLTVSITAWLRSQTALPVDFQIQPQSFANEKHDKHRSAVGMRIAKREAIEIVEDFKREMEETVIPEVIDTISRRQELAAEDHGIIT